jgi:hypothetical protein
MPNQFLQLNRNYLSRKQAMATYSFSAHPKYYNRY